MRQTGTMRLKRIGGAVSCAVLAWAAAAVCGCGGNAGAGMGAMNPISVSLVTPTVTVEQGGPAVSVVIKIDSPSETAVVQVGGLPAGLTVKYSASDTNPSGILTFMATADATKGTFMPTVTVLSAGQTAATAFTLKVVMQ